MPGENSALRREHAELILLTGGSANGKSTFAVDYAKAIPGKRVFVDATPPDETDSRTDALLRSLRRSGAFQVVTPDQSEEALPADVVLLDCLCKLTASDMFDKSGNRSDPCAGVLQFIRRLREKCSLLLLITNDVGSDGGGYDPDTAAYIRALGQINALVGEEADRVWEIVCGIPTAVKGGPPEVPGKT